MVLLTGWTHLNESQIIEISHLAYLCNYFVCPSSFWVCGLTVLSVWDCVFATRANILDKRSVKCFECGWKLKIGEVFKLLYFNCLHQRAAASTRVQNTDAVIDPPVKRVDHGKSPPLHSATFCLIVAFYRLTMMMMILTGLAEQNEISPTSFN